MLDWKKYLVVFLITGSIFVTALYASSYFSDKKIAEIRSIEDKISIDILSSETEYSLLSESTCSDINDSVLSDELNNLSSKLDYMEQNGRQDEELARLKKYYSLLEIKDYLLLNKITAKCNVKPLTIIYFYSNSGDCPDCQKTGYVLTYLRQQYPDLRVYSFDYNIDLSAVQTLIHMNKLSGELPILVINGKNYNGYKSVEDIQTLLPGLASSTATSTVATTTTKKKK